VLPPGRAVLLHDAPDDLTPLLLAADLCMASDESTLYEAVYLGTPTLALPRSAREMRIAAALAARGAVLNLGLDARSWTTTLGPVVRALLADAGRRRALSLAGRRLIDGRGAARLADALVAELVA
jgi:spore coat polysaccharide biosynthesis predicted glycosyltransferase SpsG